CGKYTDLSDSYKSLNEALRHAGIHNHARVNIEYVDSETLTHENVKQLDRDDALLVPGGFGKRGVEGKILTAQYAREHKVPYLGICLGMQVATIEFARHKAGLPDANSTEFEPETPHPVIALIEEWQNADGSIQKRNAQSDLGGTMRLGAQSSDVKPGTLAHEIYGDVVTERHRARHSVHLQEQLRQGQPVQRQDVPRPGHGTRPGDPGPGQARAEAADPHRRACNRRDRSGRGGRRRAADAGLPVPPDRFHP